MKWSKMDVIKKKIEDAVTSLGFDNNVNIDICWFDKNRCNGQVLVPAKPGERRITLAIKLNKEIHDNDAITNKNDEHDDSLGSARSSPCVVFHSTKLFKVFYLPQLYSS